MTREQTIKALEVLDGATVMVFNRDFDEFQTAIITAINALSLILEQEKRIEELTLEKVAFEAGAKYAAQTLRDLTVIKMQSEIESRCVKKGIYPRVVERVVDEVAKEMLEGIK